MIETRIDTSLVWKWDQIWQCWVCAEKSEILRVKNIRNWKLLHQFWNIQFSFLFPIAFLQNVKPNIIVKWKDLSNFCKVFANFMILVSQFLSFNLSETVMAPCDATFNRFWSVKIFQNKYKCCVWTLLVVLF